MELFGQSAVQSVARVLVDGFNDMVLDYAVPPQEVGRVQRGSRVILPLRNRTTTGTVCLLYTSPSPRD